MKYMFSLCDHRSACIHMVSTTVVLTREFLMYQLLCCCVEFTVFTWLDAVGHLLRSLVQKIDAMTI